eukprot:g19899.t1
MVGFEESKMSEPPNQSNDSSNGGNVNLSTTTTANPPATATPPPVNDLPPAVDDTVPDAAGASPHTAMDVDAPDDVPNTNPESPATTGKIPHRPARLNMAPPEAGKSALDPTIQKMQKVVNCWLDKLFAGTIDTLPPHVDRLIDRLVSLRKTDSSPSSSALSFLSEVLSSSKKPARVSISAADVKQLPRLTGAADVDVLSVLSQFTLVCSFRVKAAVPTSTPAAELESLSDQAAFERVSLICDGPILQLYQQIIEGSINWHAPQLSPTMSASPSASPGSHKAPQNWNELKPALLDCLMPANSVEESALRLATFSMDRAESVASFALRFQSEVARYLSSFQRMSGGNPFDALTVVLFRNGLVPVIKLLASQEQPPKTMQEAVSQARRLEASNLTGLNPGRAYAHASALSFTHVPNRSAIDQQYESIPLRAVSVTGDSGAGESGSRAGSSGNAGSGSGSGASANAASEPRQGNGGVRYGNGGGRSGNGGGRSGNGGRGGAHANCANRTPGPRPRCTHSRCRKPLGHSYETCYQRQREEGDGGSGGGGGGGGGVGGGGSGGHRGNGDNKRAKRNNSGNNSNSI